jgi:hypothetical protein
MVATDVLAALNFGEGSDQLPIAAVEPVQNDLPLTLQTQTALPLAYRATSSWISALPFVMIST